MQNLRIYERSLCRGSILDLTWQNSIRSSISLGLGNITFIYGHRTRVIVETRQTEDGKGEMGSRARSWGGLLCTWPTCGTPAVTREGIEAFARISSRFWPRTESEVPWIFPIRDEICVAISLSLSPSLSPRGSDLPARSESRCAEKEDLSRRDVVLTSVSRRRGPRDLDNRSRRARQGRVTVRRMKVTRIIHGPVFLFSKIERWSQESTGYYRRAEIGKGLGNSKRRPAKRAAGLSSSGLGDTARKKVLARHKASTNIIRVFENGWKDSRVFLFWPCSSKRCTVSVEEREGGGEERRWHFDEDRIVSQESHFSRRNSGGITHDKRTFTGWRGRGKGYRRYTASLLSARILVGRKTAFLLERASPMLLPRLLKTHSLSVLTLLACATCSSQFATWTRYTNRRFTGKLVSKFLKRESESFDERFCYTARILVKLTSGNSFSVPTLRVHSLSDPEFLYYNSDTNIW